MSCEEFQIRPRTNVVELLKQDEATKICAPMVRYSKLAFRQLVRKYGCDIAYTPMIVSDCFVKSQQCRDAEFTTNAMDTPLIVQFAANNPTDFAAASELIYPYADGVDLNCGCPQRWARAKGYGAKLLQKPEELAEYIRSVRSRIPDPNFSVSVKIRLHNDYESTVRMCQCLEKAGVSYVTVHGRTTAERHQPVHYDAIKLIKDSISIPVVANGDVTSLANLQNVCEKTGADGVMVARGMLKNPALFQGYECTPWKCVKDWMEMSLSLGTHFTCFHNHLIYMLEKVTTKSDRRVFNTLKCKRDVIQYLNEYMNNADT